MNKILVTGRLTADPEKKTVNGNKELCEFTVAVDDGFGERKTTTFYRCTAWETLANVIVTHLHKGERVLVEGKPGAYAYVGKDGTAKHNMTITVNTCEFLSDKRKQEEPKEEFQQVETPDLPF